VLKAVVLAGGKGTRLRPLTYTKPKPLLPLAGEPAIAHLIRKLARGGIEEIILTTNYFAKRLRAELGDGSNYGVRIHHVEEKSPLGTAGSVKNSESLIDGTFLVVQGDNQFEFDPRGVVERHRELDASATLALIEVENQSEYGIADLSEGRITCFLEKPRPEECFSNLINSGFYVLEPEVLRLVPDGKPFDFSRNLFPMMLKSRMTLGGYRASGFWVDIGDPESYLKANTWAFDKLESERRLGEGRIICGSDTWISEGATVTGPVYLGNGVRVHKDTTIGHHTYIGEASEVSAGAKITSSVVYENTSIGADAVLDACVVAENSKIGRGVQSGQHAVVSAGTELGDNSRLVRASKIGPWVVTSTSALVEGTVSVSENQLERISGLLEKSREGERLAREEGRICCVLAELGEADAETIARSAQISASEIHVALSELKERRMIISLLDRPGVFGLASPCTE